MAKYIIALSVITLCAAMILAPGTAEAGCCSFTGCSFTC